MGRKSSKKKKRDARLPKKTREPEIFVEYDITWDPISTSPLPPEYQSQTEEIFDLLHIAPAEVIPRLEQVLEDYPDIPMVLNWLKVAYSRVGDKKNAERFIRLNYQKNPDYVFAKVNYADSV